MKIPRLILERLSPYYKGKSKGGCKFRNKFSTVLDLVDEHFESNGIVSHPCRKTLTIALSMLKSEPAKILETGSSAWGTNSSVLFDSYVNSFGGNLYTCDIRVEPMFTLSKLCSSKSIFYCQNSIIFLKQFLEMNTILDLVYLDSWDVDWADPIPSAIHGFNEFFTILPTLKKGSLLLIDDTPLNLEILSAASPTTINDVVKFKLSYGFMPGKGALIKNFLEKNKLGELVSHEYQLLWRF